MKEINIIAAMTPSGVIGKDGTMPWNLPEDLKLFKRHTLGNIVIMGRRTFESIGRPLPKRTNMVISGSIREEDKTEGILYFRSLDEALAAAQTGPEQVFIIGGANIYSQMIGRADRLYISKIHNEYEGDTFFPEIDENIWKIVGTEEFQDFTLCIFERK